MSAYPLVLAELRKRAADLELRAAQLDVRTPGEHLTVSRTATTRHWERTRVRQMATFYRELIAWAEAREDE